MNMLVFANGFDNTNRLYKIGDGVSLPSSDIAGVFVVPAGSARTDAVGFACHSQTVVAQADKEPVTVSMYVTLISKQFAPPDDADFPVRVLQTALSALQLQFVDIDGASNITGLPSFILREMRDTAIQSAIDAFRRELHQQAMMQQAANAHAQHVVTPPKPGLVVTG